MNQAQRNAEHWKQHAELKSRLAEAEARVEQLTEAAQALIACEEQDRAEWDARSLAYVDQIERRVGSRAKAKMVVDFVRDGSRDRDLKPMEDAYQRLRAVLVGEPE